MFLDGRISLQTWSKQISQQDAKNIKKKMNVLNLIKIKNLCPSKNNIEDEMARHVIG